MRWSCLRIFCCYRTDRTVVTYFTDGLDGKQSLQQHRAQSPIISYNYEQWWHDNTVWTATGALCRLACQITRQFYITAHIEQHVSLAAGNCLSVTRRYRTVVKVIPATCIHMILYIYLLHTYLLYIFYILYTLVMAMHISASVAPRMALYKSDYYYYHYYY